MSGRQVETWRPLDKHSPRENFAKSALVERAPTTSRNSTNSVIFRSSQIEAL